SAPSTPLTSVRVDSKLSNSLDLIHRPIVRRPAIRLDGNIGTVESRFMGVLRKWLRFEDTDFIIDVPTALSAITSLLTNTKSWSWKLFIRKSCKCQLWAKILSDAFSMAGICFEPIWELHHFFPVNAGKGSGRSDFATVFISEDKCQYAFFMLEFEVDEFEIHKDHAVILAEAVFEMNRTLSAACNPSPNEVTAIRMHIALANDTYVKFGALRPIYNKDQTALVYAYDQNQCIFNLHTGCIKQDMKKCLEID
ncbi:10329_t:CDS:2, partial [Ambispora gerdemannii]